MKGDVKTIEGGFAIIEIGVSRYKIIMPVHLLPQDVKEGQVLNINMELDRDSTQNNHCKVTHIKDKLDKRNKNKDD
ncbi:MAG: DUF3006 domain-containing protein [Clostridiales bacterium]|nr:DUF3006 domain-containing protein [Clostridiales bacterium]MCF8022627.1 DUF3006 domain-containing protein [Clostridiales bacterium]